MPRSSEFFAAGGILSRRIPGFAYRPCQEGMAELVEKALSSSCHAVVEAGTGTGKSYAYIVPLMLRAAEGLGKEIIATSTMPLMGQLLRKDIPQMLDALSIDLDVAALYGRGNYLCALKWDYLYQSRKDDDGVRRFAGWVDGTETGLRDEIADPSLYPLFAECAAERESCIGRFCPYISQCFYYRARKRAEEADIIVYAGSLVNPGLLSMAGADCEIYNSAKMTLEEVMDVMTAGERAGKKVVRLHTGDPCLYGAIREQMDALEKEGISYEVCPGVSSFCGAAAALGAEYTLPGVSQSVVITRMAGRTPVPERESIQSFAAHQATMVIFLSTGMLKELSSELISGGYEKDTPAAIVYKATWPEEKVLRCTVGTLAETAAAENVTKTALIVVGRILEGEYDRSKLYDPSFTTEFRKGSDTAGQKTE